MKQLLALLLLGCVFAHHEGEKGAEKKDPCTNGMAAVQLFMGYSGCPGPNPYQIIRRVLPMISSNMTVYNMNHLFTNLCSTLFPRITQCFQRNILNCSLDQRISLMRVVQETGFVCEPNSNRTNHEIKHLLAKLTDSDLAGNETCSKQELPMVHPLCTNRSLQAIGANPTNVSDMISSLSMEQLARKIQTFTRTMIECVVSQTHVHLSSCSQWRGRAIRDIRHFILPPVLGKSMPFTTAELDRLFQWQSGGQTEMNVEQDVEQNPLLSLFK